MAFALKYGSIEDTTRDNGLIYFDAITNYTRDFQVQVTSHPLANGTQITDHSIRQNPKYNISAVISGVDISTWTSLIRDLEDVTPYNVYSNNPVQIDDSPEGFSFIPDTIGQFLQREEPDIVFDTTRTDFTPQVEERLINLMEGFIYDVDNSLWKSNVQLVTLYELDGLVRKKEIPNLVVTSLQFQESPESGDALVFSMSLEQITFKYVQTTALSEEVVASLKAQTAAESKKGNADSTAEDTTDPDNDEVDLGSQDRLFCQRNGGRWNESAQSCTTSAPVLPVPVN